VGFTAVADLSPLRSLTRLARLETKVVDLAVVAQLTSLKELSIARPAWPTCARSITTRRSSG